MFGITVVAILMTLYEWQKMNKNQKKEKRVFVTLTMAGWLLAVLLVFFPDMPGPRVDPNCVAKRKCKKAERKGSSIADYFLRKLTITDHKYITIWVLKVKVSKISNTLNFFDNAYVITLDELVSFVYIFCVEVK